MAPHPRSPEGLAGAGEQLTTPGMGLRFIGKETGILRSPESWGSRLIPGSFTESRSETSSSNKPTLYFGCLQSSGWELTYFKEPFV